MSSPHRRLPRRRALPRPLARALLRPAGPPLDPDPDRTAPCVPQAPLPARLPDLVQGGRRPDLVAVVCRIPLDPTVPHPTTLSKLVRRCGPDTIAALNTALLARLADDKLLRCRKLRVDTTVVGANVAYPTDVGLLARAVAKLVTTSKRGQAAGGAPRTRVRDRRRAARRRAHQVARALRARTGDAKQLVLEVTGQVAAVAAAQLADAGRVVANARRAQRGGGAGAGRRAALTEELHTTIQRTRRLLDQARVRLAGGMPDGATRLVSLHDPDARPIRKGRLGRPVEFGYKAQVVDNP